MCFVAERSSQGGEGACTTDLRSNHVGIAADVPVFSEQQNGWCARGCTHGCWNLVEVLEKGFNKYMAAFKPFLLIGLKNVAEYQV